MKIKTLLKALGIGITLFALLIIGGWAFVGGIGLLFAMAYRKNKNRGSLLAAASFLGLGLGLLIELLLGRAGGVAIMLGIAVGLLGMAIVLWSETLRWAVLGLSLCLLVLTAMLWSYTLIDLSLYLSIFPFGVSALLILAAYQYWHDRKLMPRQ